MKPSRRLLIGLAALLALVLAVGLASASDAVPVKEPDSSPFFEATLQQAVDELNGKAQAPGVRQPPGEPQPTQHYTFDPILWPECGEPTYTWNAVVWPWCHFTSDPSVPECVPPWYTKDYTWDSELWTECDPTGIGITQDPTQFWCDPAWTSDAQMWPQCAPGYTLDPTNPPWCNPRYTSSPNLWPTCQWGVPYTSDPGLWPECRTEPTSDPYLWPECHFTSDPALLACSGDPPDYPTQDYTSNAAYWKECDPAFTTDPNLPECEGYTLDPLQPECDLLYTTSPLYLRACHYTSDVTVPGCETPWPTMDFTWDAALWPQFCGQEITYDAAWWCEPFWTTAPDLWPGCEPTFTRSPDMLQCLPGYTYDAQLWPECDSGLYTYNVDTWPECEFYTADVRIWSECHYTSDPARWPECAENPPFPTEDYTTDPKIWPECDVGVPSDYTTDPGAYPECHYTYDAPIWPECAPLSDELGDLGDAPDSSNHAGASMTAYPPGGPPGVLAHYPTVFDPLTGLPKGPLHHRPRSDAWLGQWVTLEFDADLLPDEDIVVNIDPPTDTPDKDIADDGVVMPLAAPHCVPTVLSYTVTITPGAAMIDRYVNVWFDWLRDGDWEDVPECPDGTLAPEWAVQNQLIPALPPGVYVFNTPAYLPWNPPGVNIPQSWMRISIAEQPAPRNPTTMLADGRGPANGYRFGETEDYYAELLCPVPVADFVWDPPTICPTTTVQFWDTSTNSPTSWSWDFGGLGSSTSQNPSFVFGSVGNHDVSLTVSNPCGTDSITKTLTVIDCTPQDPVYDIWHKDNPADDGSVPSSSPWWNSPDIWARNDGDCTNTAHQNPTPGTMSTICIRVRNRMTTAVNNITVNAYWANAALSLAWPGAWTWIGSVNFPSLAGGATAVESVPWNVPYILGHFCLRARADAPDDPIGSGPDTISPVDSVANNNNIAQRNTNIVDLPEIVGCGVYTTTVYTDVVYFDAVNTSASAITADIVFESSDFPLTAGTLILNPGALWEQWAAIPGFSKGSDTLTLTSFPAMLDDASFAAHQTVRMTMTIAAEIDYAFTIDVKEVVNGTTAGGIQYVRDLPRCLYLPVVLKNWSP